MRGRGPRGGRQGAARPRPRRLRGAAGAPPARRPRMSPLLFLGGAPPCSLPPGSAPAGQSGFRLGQASLAWWRAPCGPGQPAASGGARAEGSVLAGAAHEGGAAAGARAEGPPTRAPTRDCQAGPALRSAIGSSYRSGSRCGPARCTRSARGARPGLRRGRGSRKRACLVLLCALSPSGPQDWRAVAMSASYRARSVAGRGIPKNSRSASAAPKRRAARAPARRRLAVPASVSRAMATWRLVPKGPANASALPRQRLRPRQVAPRLAAPARPTSAAASGPGVLQGARARPDSPRATPPPAPSRRLPAAPGRGPAAPWRRPAGSPPRGTGPGSRCTARWPAGSPCRPAVCPSISRAEATPPVSRSSRCRARLSSWSAAAAGSRRARRPASPGS